MTRTCLMPAERWEIRDTWYTVGLKGTGSHHVALTDALVPDGSFFEFSLDFLVRMCDTGNLISGQIEGRVFHS